MEIRQVRSELAEIHRNITVLASLGESVIAWEDEDYCAYQTRRLRVDSLLKALKTGSGDMVDVRQIDTLRRLLSSKENHLHQIMQVFHRQDKADSLLVNHLPEAARQATQTRTIVQKKKGIAGLFGGKKKVEVPVSSYKLHSLNRQLLSLQSERIRNMGNYIDSLRTRNKELNGKLFAILGGINDHAQTAFRYREQQIAQSHKRSTSIITGLIIAAILLLAFFYFIIQRDLKGKAAIKKQMGELIEQLRKSGLQNEALILSRKKAVHTITHELRTPLTAITGYAGLMDKDHDAEKNGMYIQNIRQSSDRMRGMLNTLLDFFRLDNGKEQPNVSPCRISAIAHILETEFMPIAMNKGLSLTVDNNAEALVLTDKERILQIGNNLLSNAIKFTDNGGVSLTMDYNDNGMLKFVVEDTGTGMTEEEQQRVFGAFERLSNAATKDGFGLGLSIVQRIVAMLGGTIRLESEKGKGSSFTVEIPMKTAEELPEQINQAKNHRNRKFHDVIAIDNDEVLLLMLKEMYAQEGIHCDTCTDAAELMEMVRRKKYSLLLTDLNMPEINGFELLELLRTSNVGNSKTIPVVVTTASGSCSKEELMERGFAGCLFKPFSISELMEITDSYATKEEHNGKPDFSTLLSYGNEAVMLEKLVAETEKELQAISEAGQKKDLHKLDALTHHLRSSWEILRADQPLRELYKLLHGEGTPDNGAICHAVTSVLDKGAEIIRLAKEEKRKYENG